MNKGLLLGSVLLLAVSLACITVAVVQVIRRVWPLWSVHFLGSAGFHAVTAIIAASLLMKAVPARGQATEEAQP